MRAAQIQQHAVLARHWQHAHLRNTRRPAAPAFELVSFG
jgi:hypothetical protein